MILREKNERQKREKLTTHGLGRTRKKNRNTDDKNKHTGTKRGPLLSRMYLFGVVQVELGSPDEQADDSCDTSLGVPVIAA